LGFFSIIVQKRKGTQDFALMPGRVAPVKNTVTRAMHVAWGCRFAMVNVKKGRVQGGSLIMKCPVCNKKLSYFDLQARFQCKKCKSMLSVDIVFIIIAISVSWFLLALLIFEFTDNIMLIILLDAALGIGITLAALEFFGVKRIKGSESTTLDQE
jgi:prepilin signal peptidase PulO-like enzyme (type II secretory pathway)